MYNNLIIKFDNDYQLEWQIDKTEVAQSWASAVNDSLTNLGSPSSCHFQNFSKDPLRFHYEKMKNAYIDLKENIKDIPDIEDMENVDLEYLNKLHLWFAKNETTHQLLNEVHMNLHAIEGLIYNPTVFPTLQICWNRAVPIYFKEDDYLEFTSSRVFGDIELTYHHIGKSPFAIFLSKDELSVETLVPYTRYCSNFFIWFGCNYILDHEQKDFWKWYDKNYSWFKENLGWEKRDPRVGLGAYKVASLITDINASDLLDNVSPETRVSEIILK